MTTTDGAKAIEWTDTDGLFRVLVAEGLGNTDRIATPADLAAAIKAMPSPQRTLLLIDVVEDSSALGQVRAELEAVRLELEQLHHEAGRMHYLGNLVRQRDQAEQDELTRLMRKHPPRLEATAVTPELGLAGPWKDLARRNAVAFRDAHDQLSRTEAQLTTERARADEAESQVDEWESRAGALESTASQSQRERDTALIELAAANARVARLEEALRSVLSFYGTLERGFSAQESLMLGACQVALTAAPQASTELPYCVCTKDETCRRCDLTPAEPSPIATSPIPQVAQASALPNATARFVRPPKPDQCPGCGSYSEQERFDIEPGAGDWCQSAWHDADEAQASADRPVMLSELVAALRKAAAEYVSMGPAAMVRGVADRLEGK